MYNLNKYMINIIREYLLPIKNENKKKICLDNLIDKTWNVCANLNSNWKDYNITAKNMKIVSSLDSEDKYYWSLKFIFR